MTESQQYVETLRKEYIDKHIRLQERDELIAENNIEKQDIKGYHGREILELLQNADDAYQKSIDLGNKPDCNLVVKIKYIGNILTVANTGTFFDKEGIKAIVQGNNSPKTGRYIGNKGTGFRSVLNWATKVRIFSGEFAIEFSKNIASDIFNKIKDEPQITKQIKNRPGLYIPMLAVPQNIEHSRPQNYTTIEIEVNNQEQNDDFSVEKQLSGIDLRILLFLPNISKIEIETEKSNIVYERLKDGEEQNKMMLRKTENGGVTEEERFTLFEKSIPQAIIEDDVLKDIQLSIAVPDKDMTGTNHVYSYFPLLETDSPFNCVLHATYSLGNHRNNINLSEENKRIVKEQLSFLVEIAVKYVEKGQYDEGYRILLPSNYSIGNWRFTSSFSKFILEEYYIQLLKDKPLFQTVNRKRISIIESPKYIEGVFPKVFTKGPFEKLLKQSNDENRKNLLTLISGRIGVDLSYREEELCKCVNQISSSWSVSQQVEVFIWWNSRYRKTLPELLKTQKNQWIKFKDECYFLEGDFDSIKLPKWVRVQAIDDEYQKSLFSKSKNEERIITHLKDIENGRKKSIARIISQNNIYPTVNFKYRDRSNIIPAINTSVNTYKKAVEFVKWLWKYHHIPETEKGLPDSSMRFPSKNEVFVDSKYLFFGEEYGNDLSEYLFSDSFSAIPGFETFGIKKDDESEFKDFLIKYGVREFPEIKETKITEILPKYDKLVKQRIIDSGVLRGTASSYISKCSYNLPYIENIISLLRTLSTDNVIRWLLNDTELEKNLSSHASPATVEYYGNTQYNWHKYNGKVPNYLLFLFNEIPWVEINNKRYAPNQILKGCNTKNNKKFALFVPVITEQFIENIASGLQVKYDDVAAVIDKFAFAEEVTDLSSEVFYGLLLDLQNSTKIQDQELSRIVYRRVEIPGFNRKYEHSKNRKTFFKTGQLLVKYQGKIQYYPASESYLPSTRIINKNNFPIVEKGQRTNNANFVETFGCKEYEKDASVKKGSEKVSSLNYRFQLYFTDFQKYARVYRERNENIDKNIDKLKVVLVNSIEIVENDVSVSIQENYSLVKDTTSSWFIVCQEDFDINSLSEKIEEIYANIANTPGFDAGKIGELFRAESKRQREFLIKKEFGSLDVIEDESYQNAIKRNFCETLRSIDPTVEIENLDIDFNDFQNQVNVPLIISLFSKLSIDIVDFEKAGFVYSINLREYYASSLESFIRRERSHFKDVQYCKAINDKKLQQSFISVVDEFDCFHKIAEIDNSVKFAFESIVVRKFGEWRNVECDKRADEEYKFNYERMNPDKLFEDVIANNLDLQRMFYFGLKDEFEAWVKKYKTADSGSLSTTSEDKYALYKSVVPDETEVNYSEEQQQQYSFRNRSVHKGAYSRSLSTKSNENLKEIGNKGELSIYNLLCEKYGECNVFPRSEAFVELGILKPGQAVSGDYDVSYKDTKGNEFFVEVKTGSKNMFYMTPEELHFAKAHPDSYRVYYVYDIESNSPKYSILPNKFWENSKFQMTEIVEKIEIAF